MKKRYLIALDMEGTLLDDKKEISKETKEYLKYLDIVAIGTISDIVPLVDENRVITKLGLKLVRCTINIGLKAILNEIRI